VRPPTPASISAIALLKALADRGVRADPDHPWHDVGLAPSAPSKDGKTSRPWSFTVKWVEAGAPKAVEAVAAAGGGTGG